MVRVIAALMLLSFSVPAHAEAVDVKAGALFVPKEDGAFVPAKDILEIRNKYLTCSEGALLMEQKVMEQEARPRWGTFFLTATLTAIGGFAIGLLLSK